MYNIEMQQSRNVFRYIFCKPIKLVTDPDLRKVVGRAIAPVYSIFLFLLCNFAMLCSVLHANGMLLHIIDTTYERAWEIGFTKTLESDHPNN